MVASDMASKNQNIDRISLLEVMVNKSPAGLMILDNKGRVLMANPSALLALGIDERLIGQGLRMDGPDGVLFERLTEALKTDDAVFIYRVPATEFRSERTLHLEVVPLDDGKLLARVDDRTLTQRAESRWEDSISHTFHELKTPIAVLNLGLSNLATYYDKLSDEDRQIEINDLAEQVSQMGEIINDLYRQIKATSRRSSISGTSTTESPILNLARSTAVKSRKIRLHAFPIVS
jgi:nitrogen fixation/metabolism regulation signal transduction histidine kinase